jgi:hypothetical protein
MPAALPGRAVQWRHAGRLGLRILLPLLVLAVVVCLGLDWVVRHQLIEQTPTHGAAKLFRIQEAHPGEVPIIGSSRALCTFIPDTLGPDYYNYGINGVGYAVMDIFMRYALARPDTTPIILNLDYEMFYYQMGDLNSYLPHTNLPGIRPLLQRSGYYSAQMEMPGIRYFGCLDAFMKERLNERLQLTRASNRGASIDIAPFVETQFKATVQQRRDSVLSLHPNRELIDTLLHRLQGHPERQFVLVVAPYHRAYAESLDAASMAGSEELLARLAALPHVRLIRFDTRAWPDHYFLNTTHVNKVGAQYTSQLLRQALAQAESQPASPPTDTLATDSLHLPASIPLH